MNIEMQRPRLDPVAMARLNELDPDGRHGVVRRVLEAFESSLTRMLEQLRVQSRQGDTRAVMAVAHTLKSSAASVGALALSQTCADCERRLRDGGGGDLVAVIRSLIEEAERALVAVKAMLQAS